MIKDGSGETSLEYFDWDVSNTASSDTLLLWTNIVEATVESDVILRYTIYSDAGVGDLDRRYNGQIVLSKGTFAGIIGQYLIPTNKLVKEASVVVGGDKKGCGYLFLTYTINLTFDSSSVLTNAVMTKTTYNKSSTSTCFLPTNYTNMENISFTPTHDMHPATKKYVDEHAGGKPAVFYINPDDGAGLLEACKQVQETDVSLLISASNHTFIIHLEKGSVAGLLATGVADHVLHSDIQTYPIDSVQAGTDCYGLMHLDASITVYSMPQVEYPFFTLSSVQVVYDQKTVLDCRKAPNDGAVFEPTEDWQPATKKYVDNNAGSVQVFCWDGRANSSDNENLALWQKIYDSSRENGVVVSINTTVSNNQGRWSFNVNNQTLKIGTSNTLYTPFWALQSSEGQDTGAITTFYSKYVMVSVDSTGSVTSVSDLGEQGIPSKSFLSTARRSNPEFTPINDGHPATKKYVDDNNIVKNLPINNYSQLSDVDTFTPFYCTRLEAENGIESEDLNKLKYIEMVTTQVTGFGTCLKQILYVVNEDHYYTRVRTDSWNGWLKLSDPSVTQQYVDDKIADLVSKDINYNVDYRGRTYYFAYNDSTGWYEANNKNVDSSTAESWLIFYQDIEENDLTIEYEVASEQNFDKLKIMIGDVQYAEISGINSGSIKQHISSGTAIKFTYTKDSSSSINGDVARFRIVKNDIKSMVAEAAGNALAADTLYDNSNGTTGTVYLSQGVADYEKIEIFFKDSFNRDCCKSVTTLPGNYALLSNTESNYDSSMNLHEIDITNSTVMVSGTSITVSEYNSFFMTVENGNVQYMHRNGNDMKICKVVGYKKVGTSLGEGDHGGNACFTANTKVSTEDGYKIISELKEGDKVYSLNPNTDEVELKPIEKVITHSSDKIYEFSINNGTINTTYSHPFYTLEEGIIEAQFVSAGYHFKTQDNKELLIEKTCIKEQDETVYEIKVADNHSYFVGDSRILVHNEYSVLKGE